MKRMKVFQGERPSPVRDDRSMVSVLEIVEAATGERRTVREFPGVIIEAPNWRRDREALIYNSQGKIYSITLDGGKIQQVDTGFCIYCNNDHVLSPDGKSLAVSHHTREDELSRIYTVSLEGGVPRLITPIGPSYLHGWSPDGGTLVYCAERNGQYDIYSIPVEGGLERQLTNTPGLEDGPEYSPDGAYIWFNSTRAGLMQLFRMRPDGSEVRQMTHTQRNNWFAHVSPDGGSVAYLSYGRDDVEPSEHPANKNVELHLMTSQGEQDRVLISLFGGQGTLNVASWSPCGRYLAFVSYRYL